MSASHASAVPGPHDALCGEVGTRPAYAKGCRCAECTAANTEAQRANRERKRREKEQTAQAEWAGNDSDITIERELTGSQCEDCTLPLYWDGPGKTAQICDNGHWFRPANSVRLADNYIDSRKRKPQEIVPADMTNDMQFVLRQVRLARRCRNAATEFNTSEIDRLAGNHFWDADNAQLLADAFTVMERFVNRATTEPELSKLEQDFISAYNSQPANNVRGAARQILNELLYKTQRNPDISSQYIVSITGIDGRETGDKPGLTFDPIRGQHAQPRQINSPAVSARVITSRTERQNNSADSDAEYEDDDEDEDEDYTRIDGYEPSGSGLKALLVIGALCGIGYVVFVWAPQKLDEYKGRKADEQAHICQYSGRFRKCERATKRYQGTFDRWTAFVNCPIITACDRHENNALTDIAGFMNSVYNPAQPSSALVTDF